MGAVRPDVGLRSSSQARSEDGPGTVIEALNFERKSLPGIGVGHLGSMTENNYPERGEAVSCQ